MNATIQAKTTTTEQQQICVDGYAEISKGEFDGMMRAYRGLLTSVVESDSGMKSVCMMAGIDLAFLIETNDGRFFVQN